jgi:hypothetical protein
MAQRDNSHSGRCLGFMQSPTAGSTRRCPVKPSTPLGPDQVDVYIYRVPRSVVVHSFSIPFTSVSVWRRCPSGSLLFPDSPWRLLVNFAHFRFLGRDLDASQSSCFHVVVPDSNGGLDVVLGSQIPPP